MAQVDFDVAIIGAGVIGLAVGRALANQGRSVILIEAERSFGQGTSSRNSEVIHAGIYYVPGSLKATLCVNGRRALYQYAAERNIPHRKCGKLIVATEGQSDADLQALMERGVENGVEGLSLITQQEAQQMEAQLRCVGALYSSETGIIDSHSFMLSLLADYEAAGGVAVYGTPFRSAECDHGRLKVVVDDPEKTSIYVSWLVNAAGLHATDVNDRIIGIEGEAPRTSYAKGSYFSFGGRSPFSRLIYPLPEPGGLGVHLTLDLNGRCRFGPDVQWVNTIDYTPEPARAAHFYNSIKKYWPGIENTVLSYDFSGIRPKIKTVNGSADFCISNFSPTHNINVISMFGIESPGLTSSLALADHVSYCF